jgi:hypothetical protein
VTVGKSGIVLGWLWTLLAGAGAVYSLSLGQWLTGLLLILSASPACPLSLPLLAKLTGVRPTAGLRVTLAVLFVLLAGLSVAQDPALLRRIQALNAPPPPPVPKTLAEAQGDFGNLITKTFTTQSKDWTLDWALDCTALGDNGVLNVKVLRPNGSLFAEVNQVSDRYSGTEHYHQGGSFSLKIVSECQWSVRVRG